MKDLFYIVKIGDWYRLHIKDTHYCLGACEKVEPLLNTVKRLIRKYKTRTKILSALTRLEDKGKVNEKMTEVYAEEYNDYNACEDILLKAINDSLEKVKSSSPLMRSRKLTKHLAEKTTEITGQTSDSESLENVRETEVKSKTVVRRIRKLVPRTH